MTTGESGTWEVLAVKYAERNARTRADSFLFDDAHDTPHEMDYYIWVLRQGARVILVDTGYDDPEATRRDRPIQIDPRTALRPLGIAAEDVTEVIVTHLHYDHAGGLHLFPNAKLHLQAAEMAFAIGPCMCHDALRMPFTADHVCEAVKRLFAGQVQFHDGSAEIADGVRLHCIGGHSKGLQAVQVRTQAGWLCLASDAAHYYENVFRGKVFPLVVDVDDMLAGFETLKSLVSAPGLIVPGHDPLVRQVFPRWRMGADIWRLDAGPVAADADWLNSITDS